MLITSKFCRLDYCVKMDIFMCPCGSLYIHTYMYICVQYVCESSFGIGYLNVILFTLYNHIRNSSKFCIEVPKKKKRNKKRNEKHSLKSTFVGKPLSHVHIQYTRMVYRNKLLFIFHFTHTSMYFR